MDATSEKRLSKVHPSLAAKVKRIIERAVSADIQFRVVQGLRTFAEQDALFAKGRTKPGEVVTNARGGYSNHNYGLAVDLCPFRNGKPQWNDTAGFLKLGELAKAEGLAWGGLWRKLIDKPHIELPGLTVEQCRQLYQKGGLAAAWKAVK
jgi:peptidoglycan LD-endopeptidase CwlK